MWTSPVSESRLAQARAASEGRMGYRGRFWEVGPCDVVWVTD